MWKLLRGTCPFVGIGIRRLPRAARFVKCSVIARSTSASGAPESIRRYSRSATTTSKSRRFGTVTLRTSSTCSNFAAWAATSNCAARQRSPRRRRMVTTCVPTGTISVRGGRQAAGLVRFTRKPTRRFASPCLYSAKSASRSSGRPTSWRVCPPGSPKARFRNWTCALRLAWLGFC